MKQGERFLIVGLGLMGGSYAMGLAAAGYTVDAMDPDAAALSFGRQVGFVVPDDGRSAEAVVAGADYVVLAQYPEQILPWLQQYAPYLKPQALVTDLCGVKTCFLEQAQRLCDPCEFIACHPMIGREVSGVQNASAGMLHGANFLITPTENNTPLGVAFARQLAETLGFGTITELSPAEHDEMIAYVSQLTHAIAVCLMNANSDERLPLVTGDSFRDLTRIADINPELWSELFLANRPALLREIDLFTGELGRLRHCLETGDRAALQALFVQSGERRRAFRKKEPQV